MKTKIRYFLFATTTLPQATNVKLFHWRIIETLMGLKSQFLSKRQ